MLVINALLSLWYSICIIRCHSGPLRTGHHSTQTIAYCIAGVGVLIMGMQGLPAGIILTMSFVARMGSLAGSSATWVHTPELFNTRRRATAHSVS